MHINEMAVIHHAWCAKQGWHNKLPLEYIALIASEIGECANECRGADIDLDALGEELADIILRVVDFAHEMKIDIEERCKFKIDKNHERGSRGRLK